MVGVTHLFLYRMLRTASVMGFNVEEMLAKERSRRRLGLESMRERAEFSGGSFTIQSAQGKGTVIRVSWPSGGNA